MGSKLTKAYLRFLKSPWFALVAMLVVRSILGVFFSLSTPLWEAYDETGHYAFARYIAVHRKLPPLGTKLVAFDETHQPPLYYTIVALPMMLVAAEDEDLQPVFSAGGENWVVPAPEDRFPWRGTALALRLGRFTSLALSSVAVVFTFLALRTLFPTRERIALNGAFFVAFWPQFLFQSGTLSNDVGMVVMGAAVFWGMSRLLVSPRWMDWVVLGALAGLSTWVKSNSLALIVAAIGVSLLTAARRRCLPCLALFSFSLLALIVAGAALSEGRSLQWASIVRSTLEVSAEAEHVETPSSRSRLIVWLVRAIELLRSDAWFAYTSLFAAYSWGTLRLPLSWQIIATAAGGVLALLGLVALRRQKMRLPMALAIWLLLLVTGITLARAVNADAPALFAPRFLLVALPSFALWAAVGIDSLSYQARLWLGGPLFMGLPFVSLLSPWLVLRPAYTPPQPIALETAYQRLEIETGVTFGDALRMLGYRTLTPRSALGDKIALEVYWQVLKPTERGYGVQLDVFNCEGTSMEIQRRQTLGNGTMPTWRLTPGLIFADVYRIPLHRGDYPTRVYVALNFFDQQTNELMPWSCADPEKQCHNRLSNIPVSLPWFERSRAALRTPLAYFGSKIALLSAEIPKRPKRYEDLVVQLTWRAREDIETDYTVFLHLLDSQGKLVAQNDQPPRRGCYPSSVWRAGDLIPDVISIERTKLTPLPLGRYTLRVGLYDAKTLERLSVNSSNQQSDALEFQLELE